MRERPPAVSAKLGRLNAKPRGGKPEKPALHDRRYRAGASGPTFPSPRRPDPRAPRAEGHTLPYLFTRRMVLLYAKPRQTTAKQTAQNCQKARPYTHVHQPPKRALPETRTHSLCKKSSTHHFPTHLHLIRHPTSPSSRAALDSPSCPQFCHQKAGSSISSIHVQTTTNQDVGNQIVVPAVSGDRTAS